MGFILANLLDLCILEGRIQAVVSGEKQQLNRNRLVQRVILLAFECVLADCKVCAKTSE